MMIMDDFFRGYAIATAHKHGVNLSAATLESIIHYELPEEGTLESRTQYIEHKISQLKASTPMPSDEEIQAYLASDDFKAWFKEHQP